MIYTPTVLVLGAGASKPYGFPSGSELTESILIGLKRTEAWREPLYGSGSDVDEFGREFGQSGHLSIDSFLNFRTEFDVIGRRAIARVLLPHEDSARLFDAHARSSGWYHYLFKLMVTDELSRFGDNQISFVTFNYDRSLEHFLTTCVSSTYGVTPSKAWTEVSKINICHVHGMLGEYHPEAGLPYGANTPADVHRAAQSVKIVRKNMATCDRSLKLLQDAERVVFLGFGFDKANVGVLNPHRWGNKGIITGTLRGMTNVERQRAIKMIPQWNSAVYDEDDDMHDCLQFLRDTGVLDQASR